MGNRRLNLLRGAVWFIQALVFSTQCRATEIDRLLEMSLDDLHKVKVSGATLTDKVLGTVPASVTVFTRPQIRSLGVNYLHELMGYVPGFQSFREEESSDEYYHSVRGHRSSTSSREVLILIDGQRFNREFDNASAAPMLALGNVEKVEFIRGPGSALYGSNAFNGVISITTISRKNETQLHAGSNDHYQGELLTSLGIPDGNLDASIHYDHDHGEAYTAQDSATLAPFSTRDPHQGYDLNLKLDSSLGRLNVMHVERKANGFYVLGNSANDLNETENQFSSMELQKTTHWSTTRESMFALRYYTDSYSAESRAPFLGDSNLQQEEKNLEFNVTNDWQMSAQHSLQFGLEQRHADIALTHFDTAAFGTLLLYPKVDRDITGIYLQDQQALTDTTDLTLGVRYDHYSQIGSAWSPRFGLIQQLADNQTLKLLYGRAFRAPTTNELMLQNTTVLVGNPNLTPETIGTWELVWMGIWHRHSLTVSLYDSVIENSIVRDDSVLPTTFINSSTDDASHGIEVESILQIHPNWQLRSSYSHFYNLPADDFRQSNQLASFILNGQLQQWNLNLSATYTDDRQQLSGPSEKTLDDYWLLNSKLIYMLSNRQQLYLQIKNLLNEPYETPFQRTPFTQGLPNRSREFEIGFRQEFE